MKVGENIRKLRDLRGLSQEVLSSEVGISQKQLSRIENGHVSPTLDILIKVSETIGVKLSELLNFDENLIFNNYNNNQSGGEFVAYNNTDIKQIESLYQKLLESKDQTIRLLKKELESDC